MSSSNDGAGKSGFGIMHAGMVVCCAVMLVPVAGFFIAGGTLAGLTSNLGVFAPIALCIGVHVAMFALMGRSCHGAPKKANKAQPEVPAVEPTRIPATRLD